MGLLVSETWTSRSEAEEEGVSSRRVEDEEAASGTVGLVGRFSWS